MKARKAIAITLAAALLVTASVFGTIAWLTQETDPVVNVFHDSDIQITLTESKGTVDNQDATKHNFEMIPGFTIEKDPLVTVAAGSEDCFVFIKVTEAVGEGVSFEFDNILEYTIAEGWVPLEGHDGVYYREVASAERNQEFKVLKDDEVRVLEDVSKDMLNEIKGGTNLEPTLTFKAYAIQKYKTNEVAFTELQAWEKVRD